MGEFTPPSPPIYHLIHSFQSITVFCFVRDASFGIATCGIRTHNILLSRVVVSCILVRKWNSHHLAIYSCFYEIETVFDWSLPKTLLFNLPRTERVRNMSMRSSPSKFAGTAVLTIALLSLQGALWYFRPHSTGNEPPLNRYSVVNIHGGNRKLLDVNFRQQSDQQLSSSHLIFRHDGRTNDHQKLVSCTLSISVQMEKSL